MAKKEKRMYLMVIMSLCGLIASSVGVGFNTAGLFYTPVAESLNISKGSISLTYTIISLLSAFVGMLVPKVTNSKTFKPIVWLGSILLVGGTALLSLSSTTLSLYFFSVLRGIGIGLIHFVMVTFVLNNWFIEKYSLVASIVLSFSGIPGAVFSGLISSVIESSGWRAGYLFVALIMLLFNLPAMLFPISLKPGDKNMKAYGEKEANTKENQSEKDTSFRYTLPSYMLLLVFVILASSLPAVSSHLPSYAESIHFSASVSALTISFCMAMNILSKILFGVLSEKIGTKNTVFVMCILNALSAVLLLNAGSPLVLYAGSFLFGTIYGETSTGNVLITKELFKDAYGMAFPLINFLGAIFGAIAAVLLGMLYDVTGSYVLMFICVISFQFISLVSVGLAYKVRQKELTK